MVKKEKKKEINPDLFLWTVLITAICIMIIVVSLRPAHIPSQDEVLDGIMGSCRNNCKMLFETDEFREKCLNQCLDEVPELVGVTK